MYGPFLCIPDMKGKPLYMSYLIQKTLRPHKNNM